MERAEIYLSNKKEFRVDTFFDTNNEYADYRLVGRKAEIFINGLYNASIRNVREENGNLIITYNGLKLIINEYLELLKIRYYSEVFKPILLKIKKFEEQQEIKKLNKPTVTRKNKHIKSRIIASGLTLITISGIFIGMAKTNKKKEETNIVSTVYTQLSDEYDEIKDHFVNTVNNYDEVEEKPVELVEKNYEDTQKETNDVHISYEDRTSTAKAISVEKNYKNIIEKYSKIYGLDPKLIQAIATQEAGDHYSNVNSGPAVGLMQIEKSVWNNGGSLKAYNFSTNSWESIKVTKDNYASFMKNLKSLDYNIKIGCMMFQESLRNSNYNILVALQNYNMGYGNIHYKILKSYCADVDKTEDEVLNDQYDTGWLDYRNLVKSGDQNYIENVLSYYGEKCNIEVIKPDGTKVCVNVDNNKLNKVY